MKSLTYIIIIWLLFQSLVEINCQMTAFKPRKRYSPTATFIDDKLYILGGHDDPKVPSSVGKDFFYLNVSGPFNTNELPWNDLTSKNIVPSHLSATSVRGGANNDTLFLYGGFPKGPFVYTYSSTSNTWDIPKISGD